MHPWHDIYVDDHLIASVFPVVRTLEHKQVVVEDFMGPEEAVRILEDALDLCRQLRRGELADPR